MARAAVFVSKLRLAARIPARDTRGRFLPVMGLCALLDEEVLLAYGAADLSALLLNTTQISPHVSIRGVYGVFAVAFDAKTDTLMLLVAAPQTHNIDSVDWQLVSLRREASEWLEVQRLQTGLTRNAIQLSVKMAEFSKYFSGWSCN